MRKSLAFITALAGLASLTGTASAAPTGNAIAAQTTHEVVVAGAYGVPVDAKAVMLNVTAVDSGGSGYATVYPCGEALPNVSNLNVSTGQTVPNAVIVRPGIGGKVCIFGSTTLDAIVDVSGYFPASTSAQFLSAPSRVLDTRTGVGAPIAKVAAQHTLELTLIPPAGTTGAILNVTVTNPAAGGYATVFPCGQGAPDASNLNFAAGTTAPNLVVVKPSADNKVCFFTSAATDILADLTGWVTDGFAPSATPERVLDTRSGVGAPKTKVAAGTTLTLPLAGPDGASAAVVNVTVTNPSAGGYVTVYPCGATPPNASNLNFAAGQSIPNLVVVKPGAGNAVCFFASAATDLIADLSGWLTTGYQSLDQPARAEDTRSCGFIVSQEALTPTNAANSYHTQYWATSTKTGAERLILDEFGMQPGAGSTYYYGTPFVGTDCFIYVIRDRYTHPATGVFNYDPEELLKINAKTGVAVVMLGLPNKSFHNVVGQDPLTKAVYLAEYPDTGENNNVVSIDQAGGYRVSYVVDGYGISMSRDARHTYFFRRDGSGTTRTLIDRAVQGSDVTTRTVSTGFPIANGGLVSPDGTKMLISSKATAATTWTASILDIASGTRTDVGAQNPIGWAPDSRLAERNANGQHITETRADSSVATVLNGHGNAGNGIFSVIVGP